MYIPNLFRDENTDRLVELMRQNGFATVVSVADGAPVATHLPVTVDREGERIVLRGHFAKANPHWTALEQAETLVVFTGPHAYVSPDHYEARESVPTWNYLAVHAYGQARVTDGGATLEGLKALVHDHEPAYQQQWEGLSERYRDGMLRGIVGFEMPIVRLEGVAKLSQNKQRRERERIAASLIRSADAAARGTGAEMQRRMEAEDDDGGASPT